MLAEALKAREMKQEDLARLLGTTQSSISGWINGKYEPAAATVFTVERSLGMDPGTLSRPLGYLPVEPASRSVSVERAIAQSTLLDGEQKAALCGMYRVLVKLGAATPASAPGPERPRNQPATANRSRLAAPGSATNRPRTVAGGR
ncbi:MAG: helix-turn-helix transcriptional regulator [Actinomycetota bacterium]|nr:helix-turn-helix transcriptional regulator [Actinomycetota bacterium]